VEDIKKIAIKELDFHGLMCVCFLLELFT